MQTQRSWQLIGLTGRDTRVLARHETLVRGTRSTQPLVSIAIASPSQQSKAHEQRRARS